MRLLIINPNTTAALTDKIVGLAKACAAPGTTLSGATAPFGAPYISSPDESAAAERAVVQLLSDHQGRFDAVMIASSSDSGLEAARAAAPRPVTAMSEAAMFAACQLGRRFAVITFQAKGRTMIEALAGRYGLEARLASVRLALELDGGIAKDETALEQAIVAAGRAAKAEDGAGVVIVGGSAAAHLTARLSRAIGLPVIDGISAGVAAAELLHKLAPRA